MGTHSSAAAGAWEPLCLAQVELSFSPVVSKSLNVDVPGRAGWEL